MRYKIWNKGIVGSLSLVALANGSQLMGYRHFAVSIPAQTIIFATGMAVENYNLRVYGLLVRDGRVLVTHEHRAGICMTKFPGGGLEKGEGLADGLRREFIEELDLEVTVGPIYYVNDFLQLSAFNPADQLISFYFLVEATDHHRILTGNARETLTPGCQIFEWVPLNELDERAFTFPIDRVVAQKLRSGI